MSRAIPLWAHVVVEMVAAPAIMVAPFLLDFGPGATVAAVTIGVLLLGHALQVEGPRRTVPLSAHAGFDYVLAVASMIGGLAIGTAADEWAAGAFLVGVGVAQVMLTASTRFSVARGA
ncbi:MAG: hypothetical protein ACRDK9_13080 [Solirubrobacterales bacterium]